MPAQLLTHRDEHTLILTLSDPASRNALSPQVYVAGIEALNTAESDPDVRAVVITGDGGHFCAGGDLNRLRDARQRAPSAQDASLAAFHDLVQGLQACSKPVIAAVEGAAAGAGFSLALACDLIVAARDARFVLSYGRVGLTPDGGASWFLARALPRALALELTWLAEPVSAERLQALGVVNRLADTGQALGEALQLATRLAAMAPNALAEAKTLLQQAPLQDLRTQLDAERAAFIAQLFHDNAGEGIEAFWQRRPPRFR